MFGEYLPPGAGVWLVRDVIYFPDAPVAKPITILAVYVAVGWLVLIVLKVVDGLRDRERRVA